VSEASSYPEAEEKAALKPELAPRDRAERFVKGLAPSFGYSELEAKWLVDVQNDPYHVVDFVEAALLSQVPPKAAPNQCEGIVTLGLWMCFTVCALFIAALLISFVTGPISLQGFTALILISVGTVGVFNAGAGKALDWFESFNARSDEETAAPDPR
jgi:hypothetical protein